MLEVDRSSIEPASTFAELGADSLSLVGMADVIEATMAARQRPVRIDDAALGRMQRVSDVVEHTCGGSR